MTSYLLDTSVVSALAPGRAALPEGLRDWLLANGGSLHVSVVTVTEIEAGIAKLRRAGAEARSEALTQWLDAMVDGYADRVLPLDATAARIAGRLSDAATAAGHHPGFADVAIAAIAVRHGLVVLTRNLRHFAPLAVPVADPFERLPG